MNVHTMATVGERWKDEGEKRELSFKSGRMKVDVFEGACGELRLAVEVDGFRGYRTVVIQPNSVSVENS